MDDIDKMIAIATSAVMTTLLDMDGHAPKSIMKMALQEKYPIFLDLGRFVAFCNGLAKLGWVTVTPNLLTLTEAGRVKAEKLAALYG